MAADTPPPPRSILDRMRAATREHARVERERGTEMPVAGTDESAAAAEALPDLLEAEWRETELGRVLVRDERFRLDHPHGGMRLDAALTAPAESLPALWPRDTVPEIARLGFFDLETTGLSGGTGNYFFLAGLGRYDPGEGTFRVRQYFLADLSQEPALLAALVSDLEDCSAVVTYNGRAFDLPLVETRLLLTRQPSPVSRLRQLDLLHAVRRLWGRRLPSCRLAEAEEQLLEFQREDDLPGWMAPSIYFDYLRAARVAPLRGVLKHNTLDILSLAALLGRIMALLAESQPAPDDAVALAHWWELAEERERARQLYADALPSLDDEEEWERAAERCARLAKRAGRRAEAVRLWEKLWDRGHRRAGIELAKHLEHHARDLAAAEVVTRRLLELVSKTGTERSELDHRLRRLQRKQGRRK